MPLAAQTGQRAKYIGANSGNKGCWCARLALFTFGEVLSRVPAIVLPAA